ncbi:anti-repressor SinI family protein [Alteribacillus sp. HJP-4]
MISTAGVKKDNKENTSLDSDWIRLISEAKQIGLTPEEVRNFLQSEQI